MSGETVLSRLGSLVADVVRTAREGINQYSQPDSGSRKLRRGNTGIGFLGRNALDASPIGEISDNLNRENNPREVL